MSMRWCLTALAVLLARVQAAPPLQIPLLELSQSENLPKTPVQTEKKRPLHGRFLQITDLHPDSFYKVYSSTGRDDACHRGQGPAGIYGAETSECDSPIALVNKTMEWIGRELRDQIDFVIWTGDSARHDNDEEIPRSQDQVLGLNSMMVQKINEVFGKHNGDERDEDPNNDHVIPIVPNLGNNDILPHNIMRPGPNKWTRSYAQLWRQFIPEEQRHQFEQGGWYYVEVIPRKLAVFSLNTLFFFASNAAADGCAQPGEPGYQQMEWLRTQLQFLRDRGMKAILMGHVPPTRQDAKTNWEETCWQKYTLWMRQYRDIIVSTHYGHFNYDHMILQDFEDLRKGTKRGKMPEYSIDGLVERSEDEDFHTTVSSNYFIELRESWADLPKPPESLDWLATGVAKPPSCDGGELWCYFLDLLPDMFNVSKKKKKEKEKKFYEEIGGKFAERYAASFVSASVVPNLFPAIRVFEYNITGLENESATPFPVLPSIPSHTGDAEHVLKKKKNKKYKFVVPDSPSKSTPPGPAYSPQTFTLIRYKQYLANLTHINNDFAARTISESDDDSLETTKKWREGMHGGERPHNKDHKPRPKTFKFELHYDTKDDEVYKLKDLTMPSLVDLARRVGEFVPEKKSALAENEIGSEQSSIMGKKKRKKKEKERKEHNKVWYTFVRRAYVDTLDEDELRDEFGS